MTLTFCPNCSNVLPIDSSASGDGINRFACRTCAYEYKLGKKLVERVEMPRKKLAEAVGVKEGYDDTAEVQCPAENCESFKATYYQLQTRSADEPMTTFYKCSKCSAQWREN